MLCGLRAHMFDIHTSTRVCVYLYTDIYERDYYRYRFTYIINTRNYCRIFKTAEPGIRKQLSLSLPSQCVALVRLANATCPGWAGRWGGRAVCLPRVRSAQSPGQEQSTLPGVRAESRAQGLRVLKPSTPGASLRPSAAHAHQ